MSSLLKCWKRWKLCWVQILWPSSRWVKWVLKHRGALFLLNRESVWYCRVGLMALESEKLEGCWFFGFVLYISLLLLRRNRIEVFNDMFQIINGKSKPKRAWCARWINTSTVRWKSWTLCQVMFHAHDSSELNLTESLRAPNLWWYIQASSCRYSLYILFVSITYVWCDIADTIPANNFNLMGLEK